MKKKYRFRSACADRTGRPVSKLFPYSIDFACQRAILPYNLVKTVRQNGFYGCNNLTIFPDDNF